MATFYIEAIEDATITLSEVGSPTVGTAMYGVNDSTAPNSYTYGNEITLTAGDKCYWTITSAYTAFSVSDYLKFASTGRINTGGSLSDLIGGEKALPRNYCFYGLFYRCTRLINASNLVLVDDLNSKTDCYRSMFYGCSRLVKSPSLPMTTLTAGCYAGMFNGCGSLATAPALPATTLAESCYNQMFYGCASLTELPELPALTLEDFCYNSMFRGCTSIKLSTTQEDSYKIPYRVPSVGTGTVDMFALDDMFTLTGGTFTGTPSVNTTYYLWNDSKHIQLYYGEAPLYPVTRIENIEDLLDSNGKISDDFLPIYEGGAD